VVTSARKQVKIDSAHMVIHEQVLPGTVQAQSGWSSSLCGSCTSWCLELIGVQACILVTREEGEEEGMEGGRDGGREGWKEGREVGGKDG